MRYHIQFEFSLKPSYSKQWQYPEWSIDYRQKTAQSCQGSVRGTSSGTQLRRGAESVSKGTGGGKDSRQTWIILSTHAFARNGSVLILLVQSLISRPIFHFQRLEVGMITRQKLVLMVHGRPS